jgi:type I restriction enzyme S subunit
VPLGSVATIERETVEASNIHSGSLYVGLENIESGGRLINIRQVEAGELASNKFRFTSNHLLYGKLRPYLAKIARPDFDGICSTDIVPISPGPDLDRGYLAWMLLTPTLVAIANSRATGANLPRISPQALAAIEIPLPRRAEQRWMAEILDKADVLRAKRRAALALLDTITHSIFVDMFGNLETNEKGWRDDKNLGDVAQITSGITKGRILNGTSTRAVPYLAVANVQDRALSLEVVKTIEATEDEITRYRLRSNDLLLTEGGDPDKLGRGSLWTDQLPECIHQNHIFRVRITSPEVEPVFLNWLIGSERGKRYFLRSAKQTTGIASINMRQLRGFPLLIPPVAQQRLFVGRARAVANAVALQAKAARELDTLFTSLQHRAFRGEL